MVAITDDAALRISFISFAGSLNEAEFADQLMLQDRGSGTPIAKRYFYKVDELFHVGGKTYAMTNQWGERTEEAVELLRERFPVLGISIVRERE